jgi:hypothetical protein
VRTAPGLEPNGCPVRTTDALHPILSFKAQRSVKGLPAPAGGSTLVNDDERPGLQALLRGARECAALLPATSPRLRAAEELSELLTDLLTQDDPQRSRG